MAMFNQQVGLQGWCWRFLWACQTMFVQCNHFASCKMAGLLKDGGKHFSGVDEVGPRIAEMLNCNALFVSGCVEAAWDQNLRRFRGLFVAVAYVKSYFLIYSFLKKYIELTVLESIHWVQMVARLQTLRGFAEEHRSMCGSLVDTWMSCRKHSVARFRQHNLRQEPGTDHQELFRSIWCLGFIEKPNEKTWLVQVILYW